MDKIREALERIVRRLDAGDLDEWSIKALVSIGTSALSAPVASDARDLVYTIWQVVTHGSGTYWTASEQEACNLIERYFAKRERKAHESCISAIDKMRDMFCAGEYYGCQAINEAIDSTIAKIKEATK